MFRLITICVIAVSTTFVGHLAARGRSFPTQVIGTIIGFNRTSQMFTIRIDEPAHVLTITVGRDCKFKRHGAPAGEQILKPGARVKVSYFATIFTGNIAVEIDFNASSRPGGKEGHKPKENMQSSTIQTFKIALISPSFMA